MTKEELKQRYSMKEIVEQYGFRPNRAGFIRCPFHTGRKSRGAFHSVWHDTAGKKQKNKEKKNNTVKRRKNGLTCC